MLQTLQIKNILLIDYAEIEFTHKLCVITGETGAGKSIILDCLLFVLGGKVNNKMIRNRETLASVTVIFDIANNIELKKYLNYIGIETNDQLIIRRILDINNRNKIYVENTILNLTSLKEISKMLIEIHGQSEQSNLNSTKNHLNLLDQFSDYKILLEKVKNSYLNYKATEKALKSLINEIDELSKEEDYLRYVIKEIEELNIIQGEEEELTNKRTYLMSKDKMIQILSEAMREMTEIQNIEKILSNVNRILSRNINSDEFEPIIESVNRASIEIEELLNIITDKKNQLLDNEDNIEDIEKRLFLLKAVAKKYHTNVDNLNDFLDKSIKKLDKIDTQNKDISKLELKLETEKFLYLELANSLTSERKKYSIKLENEIHNELSYLHMAKTQFKVEVTELNEDKWSEHGNSRVSFLASTNPGQALSPISSIASGGELSRFMLALKVAISKSKTNLTLIFDEIDSGIGGVVADLVGNRLNLLGNNNQILLITHQPQIAAKANLHLFVKKDQNIDHTKTSIYALSLEEKEEELARMLAGSQITDEVKQVVRQMMTRL